MTLEFPVLGTAQQHAVATLRRLIVSGAAKPGERVNQEDVATRAGLSVAPIREALRVLEQEGQVTYKPRRGYFVTALRVSDMREIYSLRQTLEERAARFALPTLDDQAIERIDQAARDCVDAAEAENVAASLEANRRFHFAIVDAPRQPHLLRLLGLLWDSTEAYRAMYYNSAAERRAAIGAHDRILQAVRARDADRLIAELDEHRQRALDVLQTILPDSEHADSSSDAGSR